MSKDMERIKWHSLYIQRLGRSTVSSGYHYGGDLYAYPVCHPKRPGSGPACVTECQDMWHGAGNGIPQIQL